VKRWNGSIAKTNALKDIAFGTEANVRVENGRCTVILMGARKRALTFDDGHPQGIGGFLFAGSLDRKDLPSAQQQANADVLDRFELKLKR
jgi:hypothetical protein